jgi:hypothetical protein
MRRAVFRVDGETVRARFRTFYRHEYIHLAAKGPRARVSVTLGDWTGETGVSADESAEFAGLNTLMMHSKNNDLDWIRDTVRFHVHHHGLQGVLLSDNGSTRYGTGDLAEAIRQGGATTVRVLSAPMPFGPRGKRPYANTELYLQTMLVNTHRLRFLRKARAVLSCDVDELVMSDRGSIFDQAVQSPLGFVRFKGDWRYMAPHTDHAPRHGAHRFGKPDEARCPTKWCLVPGGPMGRFCWSTHSLERMPLDALFISRQARFAHCRAITTGWKSMGRLETPEGTTPDTELAKALDDAGLA